MSTLQIVDLVSSDDEHQLIEISSSSSSSPRYSSSQSLNKTVTQAETATCDTLKNIVTPSLADKVPSPSYSSCPSSSTSPLTLTQRSCSSLIAASDKRPKKASVPSTEVSPRVNGKRITVQSKSLTPKKRNKPYHTPYSRPSKSEDFFRAAPIDIQLTDSDSELPPLIIPVKSEVPDNCESPLSCEDFEHESKKRSDFPLPQRKRACSITPPPEYSPVYKSMRTSSSRCHPPKSPPVPQPIHADLSLAIPDLDPEFKAIMREKQNSASVPKKNTIKDEAKCKIRCNFPKVEGAESSTPKFYKPIEFVTKLSDTLEQMFQHICSHKKIQADDLVVEYKGVKLYPRSTPSKLGINAFFTEFDVFTQKSYHLMVEKRNHAENIRISGELNMGVSSESEEEPNVITLSVRFPKSKDSIETFQLKEVRNPLQLILTCI
ncbi:hypothetical protein DSO57_1018814 [Entomophthora muscae]|uniref:Uncharacterized protein n=1 Tax=Entomophthora muscae TaxID=34485 RepID=A0ACC2U2P5_9FUNG|nr:hypothetical protein DSO57_1018814 [Entomophthora muscae]